MKKLLTIIIPSYNMEDYLQSCLESIIVKDESLRQTLDIIIVNDGSKDHTSDIAHRLANRWPTCVSVIDKPNGHYGSCINAALPLAQGEFVRVLDADDTFDVQAFPIFLRELDKLRHATVTPELILTNVQVVNEKKEMIHEYGHSCLSSCSMIPFDPMIAGRLHDLGMPETTFNTKVFQDVNYRQSEGIPYTDTQWVTIPLLRVKNIYVLKSSVYQYLRGREGQSMSADNIAKTQIPAMSKIALDSLKMYLENRDKAVSDCSREYVKNRIIAMIKGVFEWALLSHRLGEYDETLTALDHGVLQLSPEIYETVAERTVVLRRTLNCHYVLWFRKSYCSRTLKFKMLRTLLWLIRR